MTELRALDELAAVSDLIGSTTINGVRTLFAHRDGPVTAGILFRVGRADETLVTTGITHLVEHLALFGESIGDIHHNGETSDLYTHFYVSGSETQVVAFLNGVCRALLQLPVARIDTEKEILRTEASRSNHGMAALQRHERFGATGSGLVAQGEVGLHAVTADQVLDWARTRFVAENAVVWMTAQHPLEGLELSLPHGTPQPVQPPREIIAKKPAYVMGPQGAVLIDGYVPRSTAATMFARVASKMLFRALRKEGGYSYTAMCEYEPVDASTARLSLYADALPEQQAAVIGGMIDVLAALRAGTVDAKDLASAVEENSSMLGVPSLGAAMLPGTAINLLLGTPLYHPAEILKEDAATTVDDIAGVANILWDDALAQVPEKGLEWAGFTLAPRWSSATASGLRYEREDGSGFVLVIGPDAVSMETPHGSSTVLFDDCTGYLTFPDGGRQLIGRDGFTVSVEPTLHPDLTSSAIADLDALVPLAAHVPLPMRTQDNIPQPTAAPLAGTGRRPRWRGFGVWAAVLGVLLLILVPIVVVATISDWIHMGDPLPPGVNNVTDDGRVTTLDELIVEWIMAAVIALAAAILIAGSVTRSRWNRATGDK